MFLGTGATATVVAEDPCAVYQINAEYLKRLFNDVCSLIERERERVCVCVCVCVCVLTVNRYDLLCRIPALVLASSNTLASNWSSDFDNERLPCVNSSAVQRQRGCCLSIEMYNQVCCDAYNRAQPTACEVWCIICDSHRNAYTTASLQQMW
jgi:hypothetical protein